MCHINQISQTLEACVSKETLDNFTLSEGQVSHLIIYVPCSPSGENLVLFAYGTLKQLF